MVKRRKKDHIVKLHFKVKDPLEMRVIQKEERKRKDQSEK